MDAQVEEKNRKYQEDMRHWLKLIGVVPTERGTEDARKHRASYRRIIMQAIEHMEPADLFAVRVIADNLTCWKYTSEPKRAREKQEMNTQPKLDLSSPHAKKTLAMVYVCLIGLAAKKRRAAAAAGQASGGVSERKRVNSRRARVAGK